MRLEKLTSRLQQALAEAQTLAARQENTLIEPAHLLKALMAQEGGTTRPLLVRSGVDVAMASEKLGAAIARLPKVPGQGSPTIGNDLARLLNVADKLSQENGDTFVASEWFLVAAVDDGGEAGQALRGAGARKEALLASIEQLRGGEKSGFRARRRSARGAG